MAVPELGQLKIIPDWTNYQIAKGETPSHGGSYAPDNDPADLYNMYDHRVSNVCEFPVGTGNGVLYTAIASPLTADWICFVYNHNLNTKNGLIALHGATHQKANAIHNCTEGGTYVSADSNAPIVFSSTNKSISGFKIDDIGNTGYLTSADLFFGIVHFGVPYQMPSNATASLSYNTKYQNKVNTAFSGASYSTLYNTKPQKIISATWEYVNWSTGSSGIDDFTTMMNYSFGSHIPVALILDPDVTNTADNYMFARITKWQQTQMSPNLWKVSAEFTEFI